MIKFIYNLFLCIVTLPAKILQHTFKFIFRVIIFTLHLPFILFCCFCFYLYFGQDDLYKLWLEFDDVLLAIIKKIFKK